ncbi:MAG: low specificity L-threonine aldolase [Proteobacteria bacterium]|nr:low specificity L-threonine aldolase [Pseudomonadota bacterium]
MNFASDNHYGAAPEILRALAAIGTGTEPAYGDDAITRRVGDRLSTIFEREVFVYPVINGTTANSLGLATLTPPHGAIFCHAEAHIAVDECGAPEFFTHGAKLATLDGEDGKLTPAALQQGLRRFHKGSVHHSQPAALSLTQSTELGTVYAPDELEALGALAHEHGMKVHMDGARFANALVGLGCSPAEMTWKSGVDVLSFGATKNGALAAEAVVFFNKDDVRDFEFRRKKSGHLLSKMRFVSAQLDAYLADDLWLANARRANELAQRLAQGLAQVADIRIAHPVSANAVFASMPQATADRLRKAGAKFYDWGVPSDGRVLARLMLSFATPEADVAKLIEAAD